MMPKTTELSHWGVFSPSSDSPPNQVVKPPEMAGQSWSESRSQGGPEDTVLPEENMRAPWAGGLVGICLEEVSQKAERKIHVAVAPLDLSAELASCTEQIHSALGVGM